MFKLPRACSLFHVKQLPGRPYSGQPCALGAGCDAAEWGRGARDHREARARGGAGPTRRPLRPQKMPPSPQPKPQNAGFRGGLSVKPTGQKKSRKSLRCDIDVWYNFRMVNSLKSGVESAGGSCARCTAPALPHRGAALETRPVNGPRRDDVSSSTGTEQGNAGHSAGNTGDRIVGHRALQFGHSLAPALGLTSAVVAGR